jgi:DME family drug/metabolite transporter
MTTDHPRARGAALGALLIAIAGGLWGTTGTAATFLPATVSPLATGAASVALGGILLFAISPRQSSAVVRRRSTRSLVVSASLAVAVFPLGFYTSMSLAGVAAGTVVTVGSAPLFAACIEFVVHRQRPTLRWLLCTIVALLGVGFLAGGSHGETSTPGNALLGVLVGLAAGFAYAWYTFAAQRLISAGDSSRAVMGAMFGVGAVLLMPVLIATGAPLVQSSLSIGIIGYLAVGPMFAAYLLFGAGLRTTKSSVATVLTLTEPLVATLLAVLLVGERLQLIGWLGLLLILFAVTVMMTARRTAPPVPPAH